MKIYIPYYENCSWHTATLNSLECNLYKHKAADIQFLLIMEIMCTVMN